MPAVVALFALEAISATVDVDAGEHPWHLAIVLSPLLAGVWLAWVHLPDFMVEPEIQSGRLLNLQGRHLPGRRETLAVMRRRDKPHGPVAEALWRWISDQLRSEPGRVLDDEG